MLFLHFLLCFESKYIALLPRPLHIGAKAELGVCWGASNWAKNGAPYILVFTAILSLMEQVKTFNGTYLPKEAFFQTILLNYVYLKGENEA